MTASMKFSPITSLEVTTRASQVIDMFLVHAATANQETTVMWYKFHLLPFKAWLGNVNIDVLRPHHVNLWLRERYPNTTNGSTLNGCARAVTRPFTWACREGLIPKSPFAGIKYPRPTRREIALTTEQVDLILATAKGPFLDVVTALIDTGCRPKEARIVEAKHFDRDCWVFPADLSKGKERRVVLLTDRVAEICGRLATVNPTGPLFRNTSGRAWTRDVLRQNCYALKLPFKFSPYSLRHYWCTQALTKGVDAVVVAKLMGHADVKMVSKIYSHVEKRSDFMREALRRAVG